MSIPTFLSTEHNELRTKKKLQQRSFGKHEDSVRAGPVDTDTSSASLAAACRLPVPLTCVCNKQRTTSNGQRPTGNRRQQQAPVVLLASLAVSSSSSGRRMDVPTVTGFLMMAPNTLNKSIMLFHPHRQGEHNSRNCNDEWSPVS